MKNPKSFLSVFAANKIKDAKKVKGGTDEEIIVIDDVEVG